MNPVHDTRPEYWSRILELSWAASIRTKTELNSNRFKPRLLCLSDGRCMQVHACNDAATGFKCTPHSMSITQAAVGNKFCRTTTDTQSVCTIHAIFSRFCAAWYCSWNNLGLNCQISNSTSIAASAQTTTLVTLISTWASFDLRNSYDKKYTIARLLN